MTQDYSAWLTPDRLAVEEEQWRESAIYRLYAADLLDFMEHNAARSVIEVGCGTGWVATCIPPWIDYTGVDANAECLRLAQTKSDRPFLNADIRGLKTEPRDVVCAFAFLKHFALHEWPQVVHRLLSFGRLGLFTMNVGTHDLDDISQGFAHTWVSVPTLAAAADLAGHVIVQTAMLHTGETLVETCTRS